MFTEMNCGSKNLSSFCRQMQLVMPSVVATADSTLMMRLTINFQVSLCFIIKGPSPDPSP